MTQITVNRASYAENKELWTELLNSDPLQYPLGSPLDQEYSRAYAPHISYQDISLIARVDNQAVAGLQITSHSLQDGSKHIDFFGRSALLRSRSVCNPEICEEAERMLAEEFGNLCQSINATAFTYLDMCSQGVLSEFSDVLLTSGCVAMPVYTQMINLKPDEDTLRKDIRKRYKTFINWGENNLSITIYDRQNTKPEIIEEFRKLHIAVAGKETRCAETWQIQYKQIMANEAFLITGQLDGKLVTAALFLYSPMYCYYGVGASIREMFDKPLSHAILWRSVLEAKRRGCKLYEMGDLVDLYTQGYSDKEKNIADFKRGFGGAAFLRLKIGMEDER